MNVVVGVINMNFNILKSELSNLFQKSNIFKSHNANSNLQNTSLNQASNCYDVVLYSNNDNLSQLNYILGNLYHKHGWLESSSNYFKLAYTASPNNFDYALAMSQIENNQDGLYEGFKTDEHINSENHDKKDKNGGSGWCDTVGCCDCDDCNCCDSCDCDCT